MTAYTDVATANVNRALRPDDARTALRGVLDLDPDLVGLQEWGMSRHGLLRETGPVRLPFVGPASSPEEAARGRDDYLWVSAPPLLGGCPVGARRNRFELLESRFEVVGWPGPSDRFTGASPMAVPRIVTLAVFVDRREDRIVSALNFHLTPRVQSGRRYRRDRPLLVAHHQAEVRAIGRLVAAEVAIGRVVYAMGDSNFDGLRLPGLISAWDGREDEPGTLGPVRKVDDVHGPGPAVSVRLLGNASDHKAVIARRSDP